jgi:hypothetical protein
MFGVRDRRNFDALSVTRAKYERLRKTFGQGLGGFDEGQCEPPRAAQISSGEHGRPRSLSDGSIVRIGEPVDPAINVATKKKKSGTQTTAAKPACAADQTRSNRTGQCRPLTSER